VLSKKKITEIGAMHFENHKDALQRRPGFKVSCFKFAMVLKWDFTIQKKYFYGGAMTAH
jgi:hypothetical protein